MMRKIILLTVLMMITMIIRQPGQAHAATVLYIPADDRPVSFESVVDTARAAGVEMLVPPSELLGNRLSRGNPDGLWNWLFSHTQEADAIVVSGDSMLYGSLVGSRVHDYSARELEHRMANFAKLKELNPLAPVYVFATIMRTPKMSAGGVEPDYYERYGLDIFRISALEDKRDLEPLTSNETVELEKRIETVPQADMADWLARRTKNFAMDTRMINATKDGTFDYLILGRDDCSPLSQSHKESRLLTQVAQGLTESQYTSFPGADQLGMLLVARAINGLDGQLPFVKVLYASGAGATTVPTYEDKPVGQTIPSQIAAAGGIMLDGAINPDLVLAVNTPEAGKTLEANSPANQGNGQAESADFANQIGAQLAKGKRVAVANIAFSNGADNAFMAELAERHLLPKLAAISGWNTAGNTIGYTIGQGMLAARMTPEAKNKLIAERLLDDWAYQANIRGAITAIEPWSADGNYFYLNKLAPQITTTAQEEMQKFADTRLMDFAIHHVAVSFPWNRMFEIKVKLN